MRAVGLIAEFNPLHFGHVYALEQARQRTGADVVVVVMSGNFVQRGEPAILDKWHRAKLALAHGADLVVELPVTDAVQAADEFAQGAFAHLEALGVDQLVFGTENPTLDYMALAQAIDTQAPQTDLFRDFTQTYASQVNRYFQTITDHDLTASNTILGLTYARANARLRQPLTLIPIARQGVAHDAEYSVDGYMSASAIRQAVWNGDEAVGVPTDTALALKQRNQMQWNRLYPLLKYRLQTSRIEELQAIYTMSEGLEYRLTQQVASAFGFEDFLTAVKSKRYTFARLRRLALYTLLNLTTTEVKWAQTHRFLHVLGFTSTGREYLHQVKKSISLPLVTRVSQAMVAPTRRLALVHRSDQILALSGPQNFGHPPIMIESNRKED
ncbi:nucleotidyltransferase [Lacticaseibacillus brantae]|uniref:tRNA(Met) cytidine acetate ligase n=1 Tax=Lacticaseibacillus brantae DSM 23927 TaxID=1423727 RepID=A0A0R2B026_9LACO|nr:nucleotidyltransferase [Lacticaseibacillus brantae]KRM72862.1 hypothetical protein FC34_GL000574 [Lacticaseibacillus brantae DSM 23927]